MGTLWYKSRSVEWDMGMPAAGAKAYFFLGGVQGTPLSVYTDAAETAPHPNPVEADGNGRWPAVFIPYIASYGVRVTSEINVPLWLDDLIPNPNPVEVDVTVPIEERVTTGMFHWEPIQSTKPAYVRANGRTIGNASSGATERAHTDTQPLYVYLWNAMANAQAPVLPGGRGASAAADFAANKTLGLPNMKGAIPAGLDDMGASAGSFFSGLTFDQGNATTPGSALGTNSLTLTVAQMPSHTHGGSTGSAGAHSHGGFTGNDAQEHTHAVNIGTTSNGDHDHTPGSSTSAETTDHTHQFGPISTDPVDPGAHTFPFIQEGVSTGVGSRIVVGNANPSPPSAVFGDAPDHSHTIPLTTTTGKSAAHTHGVTIATDGSHAHNVDGNTAAATTPHTHGIGSDGAHTHTMNLDSVGGNGAVNNLPRTILGTWYIKL